MQLTETLANIERGVHITPSNYTLAQWLREWLLTYALPTVKQSTYISYESYVRLHLEPELGTTKLTALTIEQLQRFFNQKKQSLSPRSLRNIYNMLHNCLTQAVTNGYLLRSPLFYQVWNDLMDYHDQQQEMLQEQGVAMTSTTPIFSHSPA